MKTKNHILIDSINKQKKMRDLICELQLEKKKKINLFSFCCFFTNVTKKNKKKFHIILNKIKKEYFFYFNEISFYLNVNTHTHTHVHRSTQCSIHTLMTTIQNCQFDTRTKIKKTNQLPIFSLRL